MEALRVKLEGLKELEPGETDTLEQLAKELDDKEKALYRMQVGSRWLEWGKVCSSTEKRTVMPYICADVLAVYPYGYAVSGALQGMMK